MCRRWEGCFGGSNELSVTCLARRPHYCNLHSEFCSVGHHSTSDDSFAYRPRQEVEDRKKVDNPIVRFRLFMESRGWWSKEDDDSAKERLKQEVMTTFKRTEKLKRYELKQLFEDVYGGEEPWNIVSGFPRLVYLRLTTCPDRTARRVISTPPEVRRGLESVEAGVGQVQG